MICDNNIRSQDSDRLGMYAKTLNETKLSISTFYLYEIKINLFFDFSF